MMTNEAIARVVHEAIRAMNVGLYPEPERQLEPWDLIGKRMRDSTREAVALARDGHTPQQLHDAWVKARREAGWIHGTQKDLKLQTHPSLVPYAELPPDERRKDALLAAIVQVLTASDLSL